MTIELDSTLAQAEVLFLSFAQLVADVDRRRAEELSAGSAQLRNRASGEVVSEDKAKYPVISDELRDLLKTGR